MKALQPDDDVSYIGCWRVDQLPLPSRESVTHPCVLWVHPTSFAIALDTGATFVCLDHLRQLQREQPNDFEIKVRVIVDRRLLYAGLIVAALANALVAYVMVRAGTWYIIPGNVAAVFLCTGTAWWLHSVRKGTS